MAERDTPQRRIERAIARVGVAAVREWCFAALRGDEVGAERLVVLGGAHGKGYVPDGVPPSHAYWVRVWGARGLLWAGPSNDVRPLRAALVDEQWRVREMVCKVVARHAIGDLLDDVAVLRDDPVARVRGAATRAAQRIIAARA